jgi:diguanylate cyclase (GGDEF)-like protein
LHTERDVAIRDAKVASQLAITDALTGLSNRYALEDELETMPRSGSLTFIDLDSLKRYNDQFGHARGDELLCSFSRSLCEALGGRGAAYRLAGDEFAVICSAGDVAFVSQCIEQAIQCLKHRGFRFAGASYGSVRRSETTSIEQLKRVADLRMYQQKADRKSLGTAHLRPT